MHAHTKKSFSSSEEFLSTDFCASTALSLFLPSAKDSKKHGVWKSQKKSHSIMRAKRAMVTFFNGQKVIKNAKNSKLVVKRCYWKGRFKLSKNPKIQTRLFWVIFNQCAKVEEGRLQNSTWKIDPFESLKPPNWHPALRLRRRVYIFHHSLQTTTI